MSTNIHVNSGFEPADSGTEEQRPTIRPYNKRGVFPIPYAKGIKRGWKGKSYGFYISPLTKTHAVSNNLLIRNFI